MALISTFYVTFEFSDKYDFADIGASQTLSIEWIHFDRDFEGEVGASSGGTLGEWGALRTRIDMKFERFSRTAQPAYPDGQDIDDWWNLQTLWARFRYRRLAASNGVEITRFTRWNLPIQIERDFDMQMVRDDGNGFCTVEATFIGQKREIV